MPAEEVRSLFTDILNRTDCTEAQTDVFISLAVKRLGTILRLDLQDKTLIQKGSLAVIIPDFLTINFVKINGKTVRRLSDTGEGGGYTIRKNVMLFHKVGVGPEDEVLVSYKTGYGDSGSWADLTALLAYAALVFAADTFVDERKQSFEQTFQALVAEAQLDNDIRKTDGLYMAVSNPYEGLI
ncbi:hypothetical protein [Paracoccus sp. (in: a-proteobacteria)]|uniref:hypothetical protein n=1 Tax=Paracoccus sp. TaxID=267 RepID=UPI0026DF91C9|nr:hypothetical protein [Paracoccus sp. (in: a-proteobacteria)]MDO5647364.1 hypothetical protein [Paracoccus sp. (in: a-proteobacteria)]